MSKMQCVEAIYEVLAGKYSPPEHDCFDDLLNACYALVSGEGTEPDVPKWIAAHDEERSELEVCLDICDFCRRHHGTAKPSDVIARAIAAGKEALRSQ